MRIKELHFEWDDDKEASNIKKHHLDFSVAATVFLIRKEWSATMTRTVRHKKAALLQSGLWVRRMRLLLSCIQCVSVVSA